MGALTGTVDQTTQETIKKFLNLAPDVKTIYVSPNRCNLRFSVKKVKKQMQLKELDWLVTLLRNEGVNCPETIEFCNTINEIALVTNYLMSKLGNQVFSPTYYPVQDNCMIGTYHSNSWKSSKNRLIDQFKGCGSKRVIVATTALCMGVNFPDVRFIVNWGPARSILDQHQEAGRAGRDGKKSHVIIIYHGQQVGHCEPEVKDFVRAKGFFRVAAYKTLDKSIQPLEPLHDCCSFCSELCKCGGESCSETSLPFEVSEQAAENFSESNGELRQVTCQDRKVLKEALYEVLNGMSSEASALDESSSHGFSTQLIDDVTRNCESIFTLEDLLTGCPVFSISNALKVLEVIQEVFEDIPNFEESLALITQNFNGSFFGREPDTNEWFDFESITLGMDSDPELQEL